MAGIGFELKKLLEDGSYTGLIKTYGYAGIISSGPWVLSIFGIMLVGGLSLSLSMTASQVSAFLISVTWLMASSLILTGLLQLMFTRFISDQIYIDREDLVLSNFFGAMTLTTLVSGFLGIALSFLFPEQSLLYRALMVMNFVLLCNLWIVIIFASGMKQYHAVLQAFALGYGTTLIASLLVQAFGTEGLLMAFLCGHGLLMFFVMAAVLREYPSATEVRFDFLQGKRIFPILIFIGLFYYLGMWIDKILFWFHPETSESVIGPLRASPIYDLPIFLAYLSIIPGMSVFLVRVETDFAQAYQNYYQAIRKGATLSRIETHRDEMIASIRTAFFSIFKVQGLTVVILYLLGPTMIEAIGMSSLHAHIYYTDITAVGIQVMLLAVLTILFYLDLLIIAFWLTCLLLVSNTLFTLASFYIGLESYGYGFALAMMITTLVGMSLLSRQMEDLEYRTFMR